MLFRTIAPALVAVMLGSLLQAQTGSAPKLRPEMLVTTAWLAEHLHDPDLVVLCIDSTPELYAKGHIPGARQIKLSEIAVTRDGIPNELPPVEQLQRVFAAARVSKNARVVRSDKRRVGKEC